MARQQVENGAQIIDVNMDEGMLDSEKAMTTFLNLIGSEPDIARVPMMVDSSKWSVIESRSQVHSGQGDRQFASASRKAKRSSCGRPSLVRRYGAAVVVMAFDERGQADSFERKIEVCERSYRILTEEVGFPPQDIIFDPNILTVATGIEEHNNYAVELHRGHALDQAESASGEGRAAGSATFRFRSAATIRCARRCTRRSSIHAIKAGLDMGIVNAGMLARLRGDSQGTARSWSKTCC